MFETEKKYLNKLSIKFDEHNNHLNFRCSLCGDSATNPYKKRGFVIQKDDNVMYYCHNQCGGMSFTTFLKNQNETLAEQYRKEITKEKFKERKENKEVFKKEFKFKTEKFDGKSIEIILKDIPKKLKLVPLEVSKEAKQFLKDRGFNLQELKQFGFYYNKELNAIVFPLYKDNSKQEITGVQIRLIEEKKFINYTYNENYKIWIHPTVFSLSYGSDLYVFESILDLLSSGIEESIAVLGADMSEELLEYYKDYNLVFCMDNDETGEKKALKYSEKGYDVLVHKIGSEKYFKDFNDMLKKGINKKDIQKYILNHIKHPSMALLKIRLKASYELFDWN